MANENQITQEPATKSTGRPKGRPPIGIRLRVFTPRWVVGQLKALQAFHGPGTPLGAVHRDAIIAGLLSLKASGVQVEGFDPGAALIEAQRKGEPTGLLKR